MIANDSHETPGLPSSADLDAAEERVREATGNAADPAFEELKRLSAAATPGPWERCGDVTCDCGASNPNCWHQFDKQADISPPLGERGPVATVAQVAHDNASFIVAAVNYVRRQIAAQTAATPETT